MIGNYCSYVDVYDLCDAVVLAIETDLPGHEVFYIASPDTIGGHPLAETVKRYYGGEGIEFRAGRARGRVRHLDREGRADARVGAQALVARLPRRAGARAHVNTRRLGQSGPELSTVGFGAWAIGGPWRFGWGDVDDDDSVAAIRHAIELGVNWVDTAAVYGLGHSEEVVRTSPASPTGPARTSTSSRSAAVVGRVARQVSSRTTSARSRSARSARRACAGSASSASTSFRLTGPTG